MDHLSGGFQCHVSAVLDGSFVVLLKQDRADEMPTMMASSLACCKSVKLDVQALIDRLGLDHGSMH